MQQAVLQLMHSAITQKYTAYRYDVQIIDGVNGVTTVAYNCYSYRNIPQQQVLTDTAYGMLLVPGWPSMVIMTVMGQGQRWFRF